MGVIAWLKLLFTLSFFVVPNITTTPTSSSNSSNGVVIGVVMATILFIIIVLIVACFLCQNKLGTNNKRNINNYENHTYDVTKL